MKVLQAPLPFTAPFPALLHSRNEGGRVWVLVHQQLHGSKMVLIFSSAPILILPDVPFDGA